MTDLAPADLVTFHDVILNSLRVLGGVGVIVTTYRLGKRAFKAVVGSV